MISIDRQQWVTARRALTESAGRHAAGSAGKAPSASRSDARVVANDERANVAARLIHRRRRSMGVSAAERLERACAACLLCPSAAFQVGGHMFSSMAISRIPVSTTHTIKVRLPVMF